MADDTKPNLPPSANLPAEPNDDPPKHSESGEEGQDRNLSHTRPDLPEPKSEPQITQKVRFRDVKDGSAVNVVERQYSTQIENVLIGEQASTIKVFSMELAASIDSRVEDQLLPTFIYDEADLQKHLRTLKEKRLAIIAGPADYGKGVTALLLAKLLRQSDAAVKLETRVIEPLAANIRLNLSRLISERSQTGNRVVIFRDAFLRGNRDVIDFFGQMNPSIVHVLSAKLEDNGSYFVFTSDAEAIPQECIRCLPPDLLIWPGALDEARLLQGLDRKLTALASSRQLALADVETRISQEERVRICTVGKTMARIARFVEWYVVDIIEGTLSIDEAFARFDSSSLWFQYELPKDPAAWCFALSLLLLQALERGETVSWHEFYTFHEVVRTGVVKWLRSGEVTTTGATALTRRLGDQELLERSRTKVLRDRTSGRDVIGFAEENDVPKLWESLLANNRALIWSLIPLFEEIAVNEDSVALRGRVAHVLGRVGEIEPWEITRKLVKKWSTEEDFARRALVGYLFQGVRASRDKSYSEIGNQLLQELANDPDKIWTAIAAHKQIGTTDLPYAMAGLRRIAEKHMAEPFARFQKLQGELLKAFDHELSAVPSSDVGVVVKYCEALFAFFQHVFAKEQSNAISMQYVLVSLCIVNGPVPVFSELRKWMRGSDALRALVAVMFLQQKGIAAELSRRTERVEVPSSNGQLRVAQCSLAVVAMASGDRAVATMVEFLEDVFLGYNLFFPPQILRYLNDMFFHHLKTWATSSLQAPICSAAMESLFARLGDSMNQSLNEQIFNLIHSDLEFVSGKLKGMGDSILERSLRVAGRS